jgi:hypothetical protein
MIFSHINDPTPGTSPPSVIPIRNTLLIIVKHRRGAQGFLPPSCFTVMSMKDFILATDGKYAGKVVTKAADGTEVRPLDVSITK